MSKVRQALENWVYGLLGFEERTYIVARRLTGEVIQNDKSIMKSVYYDYEAGDRYEFCLTITKKPIKEEEGVIHKLMKQYQSSTCGFTGKCDYKKEEI